MVCSPLDIPQPTFLAVTGAAFVDSINPCAIAVLLILLTALLVVPDRRIILKSGFSFIAALFLAYFAVGLGLFGVIQISGIAPILHRIVAVIAIIVGLANIKDYFWYGGLGFVTEVPRKWRPTMQGVLGSVTAPLGAFVAGLLVTFFELPCTGGPYLFTLGLLSEGFSWPMVVGILTYYNLIFILPLLAILLLVYFGYTTAEYASSWKNRNIRLLHLIAGLVMVGLGIWLFFS